MNNIMEALLALALLETKYTESQVMDAVKCGDGLDFDEIIKLRDEMAGEL